MPVCSAWGLSGPCHFGPWPRILDTGDTWILMVQENGVPVGMKRYPAEFKADAVALYRSRPGATIKSVAGDLGVNTETLRNWIRGPRASRRRRL